MKLIPQRKRIPLITDLLEWSRVARDTIGYCRTTIKKYGDVCYVPFAGVRNYFIQDPEVIKGVLTYESKKFRKTRFYRAFRKFVGEGLLTSEGDFHRQQRRLIMPAFHKQRIEEYAEIMVACTQEELQTWKIGEMVNINQAMITITLQIITKTLFGAHLDKALVEKVSKTMPVVFETLNTILQNPLYLFCLERNIGIPPVRKFYAMKNEMDTVVNHIISSYRKNEQEHRNDLLSMLMEAKDEETGHGMTDEQVRDEVMTFFLAGHETTALALTWTWYTLGKHPEVENRFYEEMERTVGNRAPVTGDYPSLPYTKNILKEILRLYPPAWTFAREATEDVEILDYHFPKGSVLWTVTYLIHRNERYFDNPDEFIPERWEEEKTNNVPKYAYFPFGGGSRICIGEGFAWMEAVMILATIASTFRLYLSPNCTTTTHPVFTLRTKDDIMMNIQNRRPGKTLEKEIPQKSKKPPERHLPD